MHPFPKICLMSFLFTLSGVLFAISLNIEPPSEKPDDLVSKLYNVRYLPAVVFAFAAIFVLTIQSPSEQIPVIFVVDNSIKGMLEIKQGNAWRRIHAHQLNEWLTDEQLAALRELDGWKINQCPNSPSEVEKVLDEYKWRREQIVSIRPARTHVQG